MVKETLLEELARRVLGTVKTVPVELPAPLVYVMESARGNVYTVVNDEFEAVLDGLAESGDTVITQATAMFYPGNRKEIPSYRFRKALVALDPKNARTELLLEGRIMTIETAMPPEK